MRGSRGRLRVVLVACVAAVVVTLVWGGVQTWRAKRSLQAARAEVRAAQSALKRHDLSTAVPHLRGAAAHASSGRGSSRSWALSALRPVPWVGAQVNMVRELTDTAAGVTAAAREVAVAAAGSELLGDKPGVDATDFAALARDVDPVRPALELLQLRVRNAQARLHRWEHRSLLAPLAAARDDVAASLTAAGSALDDAQAVTALLDRAAAPGRPLRLLFLAQDSWELRPSGGFIGSYGILEIGDGHVRMRDYADATTLPDPSRRVRAPEPLGSVLGRPWQLTGAGWWPDFPTSAKAAQRLYRLSGGTRVDGVAASTQEFLEDLLRGLGPVRVPGYPETITAGNASDRILHHVELKRPLDVPRKRFLIRLTDVVFERLEHIPAQRQQPVLTALGDALRTRHLQVAFNSGTLAASFRTAGWDGSLQAPTAGDFFSLVDANMGIDKANRWVSKQIDYDVTRHPSGRLVATVTVTTTDTGKVSPVNTVYSSYARAYAPPGAHLVDATNHTHDIHTGTENGLVTFGRNQDVYPGQSATRTYRYYLPDSVIDHGTYRLTVRRQPGTSTDTIRVTIHIGDRTLQRTLDPRHGDTQLALPVKQAERPELTIDDDHALAWDSIPRTPLDDRCVITLPRPKHAKSRKITSIAQLHQQTRDAYRNNQPLIEAKKKQLGCDSITLRFKTTRKSSR